MSEIAPLIVGSEKLTSIFGRWPSFHDAEVHELHFWRGHIDTEAKVYDFPVLTVKLHLWLTTNDVDQKGYYVSTKHTLASMKFFNVDDFKMEGFNHQNAIFGLAIEQKIREEGPSPYFAVDFARKCLLTTPSFVSSGTQIRPSGVKGVPPVLTSGPPGLRSHRVPPAPTSSNQPYFEVSPCPNSFTPET